MHLGVIHNYLDTHTMHSTRFYDLRVGGNRTDESPKEGTVCSGSCWISPTQESNKNLRTELSMLPVLVVRSIVVVVVLYVL
jgi:predicted nucleic acid-binding Zn ribbon protein